LKPSHMKLAQSL